MMKQKIVIFLISILTGIILGIVGGFTLHKISLQGVSIGYIDIGQQYLKEKKYVRALASLNQAVALDQNSFIAHLLLGDTYFTMDNFDLAIEEYEAALQLLQNEKSEDAVFIKEKIAKLKEIKRN